eukprot:sb/3473751/
MAVSPLIKNAFEKYAEGGSEIGVPSVKDLFLVNLIPLSHPVVVALFDEVRDKTSFTLEEVRDLFCKAKQQLGGYIDRLELFDKYDTNSDGFISREDMKICLREDEYYKEEELDTVIDLVMLFGDVNKDDRLNYREFVRMLKDVPLE